MKVLRTMLVVVLMFMIYSSATAAITEPIITATVADTDAMTLLIEGMNLPMNSFVYMSKGGGSVERLYVTNSSPTSIKSTLKTTEPGTYIVALAVSADRFWTSTVTIGESLADLQAQIAALQSQVSNHSHDSRYVRHSGSSLRVVSGAVNSDGSIRDGEGFSVTRNSPGWYRIEFDSPLNTSKMPVVMPWTVGNECWVGARSDNSISFACNDPSYLYDDTSFSFAIFGR